MKSVVVDKKTYTKHSIMLCVRVLKKNDTLNTEKKNNLLTFYKVKHRQKTHFLKL